MKDGMPRTPLGKAARKLLDKRHREIIEMLNSCGIAPEDVPYGTEMTRKGKKVRLERFVRSQKDGRILFNTDLTYKSERVSIEPETIPAWIPAGR
jgi:hypothetical protein